MNTLKEEYLFVYGTLLSNYGDNDSHHWVKQYAAFMGKAQMNAKMFMVDYYPGIIPCEGNEKYCVKGELYHILEPEKLFGHLDKYEEFYPETPESSEYIRKLATVTLKENNQSYQAWVYFFNQSVEDLEFMPKGDFMNEYHK